MRFRAPDRRAVDPGLFDHPIFAAFTHRFGWLRGTDWPTVAEIDAASREIGGRTPRFIAQDAALLADGMHYEQRIAARGLVATRPDNWHDLFNALVWLRYPALKWAMSRRQAADLAWAGSKRRTRGQCALTHFDEAGVVVLLRERIRIDAWDRHDWPGLFGGLQPGDFALAVIGHALLEHALDSERLLCGKAVVVHAEQPAAQLEPVLAAMAGDIESARWLTDPQQLRPLPLMGLPGWHPDAGSPRFVREAPCFQPLRAGRSYPPPLAVGDAVEAA